MLHVAIEFFANQSYSCRKKIMSETKQKKCGSSKN